MFRNPKSLQLTFIVSLSLCIITGCTSSSTPSNAPIAPSATWLTKNSNTTATLSTTTPSVGQGATARCRDGSYSFSQSRRGTCSHHGGVSEWNPAGATESPAVSEPTALTNTNTSVATPIASPSIPADYSSTTSALEASAKVPTARAAIVKNVEANLREDPNISSPIVLVLKEGDSLTLSDRAPVGQWYAVTDTTSGKNGWINGTVINLLSEQNEENTGYGLSSKQATATRSQSVPSAHQSSASSEVTTGRSYLNVDGVRVKSPVHSNAAPSGASARCGDGTYSFSQHRRGTCSHHGGVAQWL